MSHTCFTGSFRFVDVSQRVMKNLFSLSGSVEAAEILIFFCAGEFSLGAEPSVGGILTRHSLGAGVAAPPSGFPGPVDLGISTFAYACRLCACVGCVRTRFIYVHIDG